MGLACRSSRPGWKRGRWVIVVNPQREVQQGQLAKGGGVEGLNPKARHGMDRQEECLFP